MPETAEATPIAGPKEPKAKRERAAKTPKAERIVGAKDRIQTATKELTRGGHGLTGSPHLTRPTGGPKKARAAKMVRGRRGARMAKMARTAKAELPLLMTPVRRAGFITAIQLDAIEPLKLAKATIVRSIRLNLQH